MDLVNAQDLAELLSAGRGNIDAALKHLAVKPVYQMAQGKGVVSIYDKEVVLPLVVTYLENKKKEAAAKLTQTSPPLMPAAGVDALQAHLDKRLDYLNGVLNDALDDIDAVKQMATKLVDQNVLLHKALESLRMMITDKVDAMQASVDSLPDQVRVGFQPEINLSVIKAADGPVLTAAAPAPVVITEFKPGSANVPERTEPKRKVAIVSLLADQKRMIEKEFGDVFDLRIFEGSEARTSGFPSRVAGCEIALIMNNFTDRVIIDHVKKSGVKVIKVVGGLTRLRTELTNVFMNP